MFLVSIGHGGWVTTLAVGEEVNGDEKTEFLMSGSRDKSLIKWELDMKKDEEEDREWGRPKKMYTGKSTFKCCESAILILLLSLFRPLTFRKRSQTYRRLSFLLLCLMGWHRQTLERGYWQNH